MGSLPVTATGYISVGHQLHDRLKKLNDSLRRDVLVGTTLKDMEEFYENLITTIHPGYTDDEHTYAKEKKCWSWCYRDRFGYIDPPFPGISPFQDPSRIYLDAAEDQILPIFDTPYTMYFATLPPAPLWNPYVHLGEVIPLMQFAWRQHDRMKNGWRKGRRYGDLMAKMNASCPPIDAWVTLQLAVALIWQGWAYRGIGKPVK
ncbi:hypothetical protein MBM_04793 [Drepanopeziza brunnea f. sp. 'multigermtubi' MB_m1]|uniref:Uncharacterized protein n=1 Tax=Marssonina brunnea f. sp. multigermtubi (strain MB_m1) TaxID=1072389 RepID=K1WW23_MARBU|nr:uncharacterized protein MBM_04793 [Drepanopeziza brunnea f. sp. 'multigermtubi' MB_m1]EKD17216.1 hypothetical protein MBM_04793 [Drepanopeziza brunnea f. sp. 'multigermtubi' MB_m1]